MMRKSLDMTLKEPHREILHCLHYLHHFTPFYKNFWHKYGTLTQLKNPVFSRDCWNGREKWHKSKLLRFLHWDLSRCVRANYKPEEGKENG